MQTTAYLDGDEWVINGHKWFTSGASRAAFTTVFAKTEPDAERHMQFSSIIVPTDTPGYLIQRAVPTMGHVGGQHCEVVYDNVRVPVTNLLGNRGPGHEASFSARDLRPVRDAVHADDQHAVTGPRLVHEMNVGAARDVRARTSHARDLARALQGAGRTDSANILILPASPSCAQRPSHFLDSRATTNRWLSRRSYRPYRVRERGR